MKKNTIIFLFIICILFLLILYHYDLLSTIWAWILIISPVTPYIILIIEQSLDYLKDKNLEKNKPKTNDHLKLIGFMFRTIEKADDYLHELNEPKNSLNKFSILNVFDMNLSTDEVIHIEKINELIKDINKSIEKREGTATILRKEAIYSLYSDFYAFNEKLGKELNNLITECNKYLNEYNT